MKATTHRPRAVHDEKFTLSLKFKVKLGLKLALLAELKTILDFCAREPEFITAILHENPEQPEEIFLFEIWRGTRQEFLRTQGPKPYRVAYMERSQPLLASVEVSFLNPTQEWGGDLLTR